MRRNQSDIRQGYVRFRVLKPLVDHNVRLDAAKLAIELLRMKPPTQVEFPDETGKPQRITGMYSRTWNGQRG